tara:strand:+ start:980 stop:1354 length:375 start_codon:yes stop_codon:yes gene_type:complete
MILWTQTILGEPASKANSRRLVSLGGKPRFIKSQKALEYSRDFAAQVLPPEQEICEDICVRIKIWYRTRRPDLDPSLIFDLLQKERVIKNDRQIKEIHAFHGLDKEKPRSQIEISTVSADSGLQ